MAGWNNAPANNSMVAFVNDESMAVNYPVSPGFTVAVINASDPENMKMYIKSSQPNGLPNPTKIFSLKDITPKAESADMVSRAEFDKLTIQIANMQALLEGLAPKGAKTK